MPWITLNEYELGDSFFIIEYLSDKFGKDLSRHLNLTQKAVSRSILKLSEESLYW